MKKNLLLSVAICLTVNVVTYAQCNPFFNFKEGSKWELTNYNGKGKIEGRQENEIKELKANGDGWDASLHMVLYDKKDRVVYDKNIEMGCAAGVVTLDMTRLISDEQLEAFQDMNMKLEMDNIEIPSGLEVGMTLDDGSVILTGDLPMTVKVTVTDRKVESKENITTPAGTFECYKISYKVATKMLMNIESTGVDYISKNVGMVRTETFNKSGKLVGYSEITKLN
ncbi:hypothetical protein FNH22_15030 [Fulvivirga sp. M361]|uniref:TapB family protein n=1 Tax=Fulvivirga sp. M361 TaxID=2594266 RepID=UPI00117A71EC|nr:hypothetical protein [Fulvivirga sp. M361]TRX57721.1 hypothetical protein FNH22_15030 [Fulvivirga sp. M361]